MICRPEKRIRMDVHKNCANDLTETVRDVIDLSIP